MFFATFILVIAFENLSDDFIKKRASNMGMVMAYYNDDEDSTSEQNIEKIIDEKNKDEDKDTTNAKESASVKPTATVAPTQKVDNTQAPTKAPTEKPKENKKEGYYDLNIQSSMASEDVSRMLYNEGIIDSVAKFNKFMVDHKYDLKVHTGKYKIPRNANFNEIASIITKNS